ncbi:hypothetical protein HK405_015703, partial [Cladochytrium tenue]
MPPSPATPTADPFIETASLLLDAVETRSVAVAATIGLHAAPAWLFSKIRSLLLPTTASSAQSRGSTSRLYAGLSESIASPQDASTDTITIRISSFGVVTAVFPRGRFLGIHTDTLVDRPACRFVHALDVAFFCAGLSAARRGTAADFCVRWDWASSLEGDSKGYGGVANDEDVPNENDETDEEADELAAGMAAEDSASDASSVASDASAGIEFTAAPLHTPFAGVAGARSIEEDYTETDTDTDTDSDAGDGGRSPDPWTCYVFPKRDATSGITVSMRRRSSSRSSNSNAAIDFASS